MRKLYYILLICLVPALAFAQKDNSAEQMNVMMKMATLRGALLSKDSVSLSNLLSDNVTYGHTNGLVQTKAQLIRSVVSGEQDYREIAPSDMKIRVYEGTGIVTMKSMVKMNYQGKPLDMSMNILLVWVKSDKDWKLVARQSTRN